MAVTLRTASKTLQLSDTDWHFVAFAWERSRDTTRFGWMQPQIQNVEYSKARTSTKVGRLLLESRKQRITSLEKSDESLAHRCGLYPLQMHKSVKYTTKSVRSCQSANDALFTWVQVKTATAEGKVTLLSPSDILPSASKWKLFVKLVNQTNSQYSVLNILRLSMLGHRSTA